jgi:hypothetical protein
MLRNSLVSTLGVTRTPKDVVDKISLFGLQRADSGRINKVEHGSLSLFSGFRVIN